MSEQRDGEARVDEDDEAFMEAWGSLKTYTLHAYSERYSPSIRHDGPNVRTYDADAVDALLARLRPAFQVGPADDPLTCSKCGGPTKENGRWHPDIGAVYGYELGLAERDPAPDTPEVAERPEKCPTCGGAPDDPGYDEINAGDQTGRDYCPDPFHTPEDTSRVEEDEPIDLTTPVRTRARLAAWREVEGDISGYDSEGYQRMIDHWPVVDDPERLGEVDEGESRVETTVIAEIDKAYARGYNDGVQAEEQPQPVASEEDRTRVGAIVEDQSLLTLDDADTLTRVLTDSETLAQYAKERGE